MANDPAQRKRVQPPTWKGKPVPAVPGQGPALQLRDPAQGAAISHGFPPQAPGPGNRVTAGGILQRGGVTAGVAEPLAGPPLAGDPATGVSHGFPAQAGQPGAGKPIRLSRPAVTPSASGAALTAPPPVPGQGPALPVTNRNLPRMQARTGAELRLPPNGPPLTGTPQYPVNARQTFMDRRAGGAIPRPTAPRPIPINQPPALPAPRVSTTIPVTGGGPLPTAIPVRNQTPPNAAGTTEYTGQGALAVPQNRGWQFAGQATQRITPTPVRPTAALPGPEPIDTTATVRPLGRVGSTPPDAAGATESFGPSPAQPGRYAGYGGVRTPNFVRTTGNENLPAVYQPPPGFRPGRAGAGIPPGARTPAPARITRPPVGSRPRLGLGLGSTLALGAAADPEAAINLVKHPSRVITGPWEAGGAARDMVTSGAAAEGLRGLMTGGPANALHFGNRLLNNTPGVSQGLEAGRRMGVGAAAFIHSPRFGLEQFGSGVQNLGRMMAGTGDPATAAPATRSSAATADNPNELPAAALSQVQAMGANPGNFTVNAQGQLVPMLGPHRATTDAPPTTPAAVTPPEGATAAQLNAFYKSAGVGADTAPAAAPTPAAATGKGPQPTVPRSWRDEENAYLGDSLRRRAQYPGTPEDVQSYLNWQTAQSQVKFQGAHTQQAEADAIAKQRLNRSPADRAKEMVGTPETRGAMYIEKGLPPEQWPVAENYFEGAGVGGRQIGPEAHPGNAVSMIRSNPHISGYAQHFENPNLDMAGLLDVVRTMPGVGLNGMAADPRILANVRAAVQSRFPGQQYVEAYKGLGPDEDPESAAWTQWFGSNPVTRTLNNVFGGVRSWAPWGADAGSGQGLYWWQNYAKAKAYRQMLNHLGLPGQQ